jgi:putative transposase
MEAYVNGVSTRKVDHLVSEMGIHMSKDQVSRICGELDGQVEAFRTRPLEGAYPYLWLDAKHLKVRDRGHVHSKALMVAFAVHASGRREVIGIEIAESETEAGWAAFLRELVARGLEGVRLAVSDDHLGLKAAIAKVIGCPWQRCTVHFIRNMHGHCKKGQRNMVSAALREVFNAEDLRDAKERSASVIERLAPTAPKVAALLEAAEEDLLAFYRFPAAHWPKLRSTNNIERVNKEIARRSDVVGIFPNDRSVIRLIGSLLIEQNDEWLLTRGYLSQESIDLVLEDQIDEDRSEVAALEG